MSIPKIKTYKNGATLIYQKDSTLKNGAEVSIGFAGGSAFDGVYTGLTHLLEHLFYSHTEKEKTISKLKDLTNVLISPNAFTSSKAVSMEFLVSKENLETALKKSVKTLENTVFSQSQIDKEIEIVKNEINLHLQKDMDDSINYVNNLAYLQLQDTLLPNENIDPDILGSPKTLHKITPEIIKEYKQRYFNSDNLIISITSDIDFDTIEKIVSNNVITKFKPATSYDFIADKYKIEKSLPKNLLIAVPNKIYPNVTLRFLLRNNQASSSKRTAKDIAKYTFENYFMESFTGPLYKALRIENQLVYVYDLSKINLGDTVFKQFSLITNKAKVKTTIRQFCKVVKNLGENGIDRQTFNDLKKTICSINDIVKTEDECNASQNLIYYILDKKHISSKEVSNEIKNLTYEEFNNYLLSTYSQGNISLSVDGNFDSRDLYSIIEMEKMIGNYDHQDQEDISTQPIVEETTIVNYDEIKEKILKSLSLSESKTEEKETKSENQIEKN